MGNVKYNGAQKAAILMLSFGEDISAEIFKSMTEFEIKRIGTAMSRLGLLDQDVVDEVMNEFYSIIQQNKKFFYGGNEYTKKVIGTAFKGGDADNLIEQLALSSNANLNALELIDPKTLSNFIRNEHPQTIALILAHLDNKKCGDTLKLLPESMHTEILLRIANLDAVQPEIIDEIDDSMFLNSHLRDNMRLRYKNAKKDNTGTSLWRKYEAELRELRNFAKKIPGVGSLSELPSGSNQLRHMKMPLVEAL
jgi:flagellar motor switch protein FliG